MAKLPFLTLSNTINDQRNNVNSLNDRIGDLALLNTAGDSDLVQAINFVDSDLNARVDSADAYFKSRIDDLDSNVGDRLSLNSFNKSSIVAAYNELRLRVDLIDSEAAADIDSAFSEISILKDRADSNDTNFVTRVRGSISGSGDISYNPATGVISIDVEQVYTKTNFDSDLGLALSTNAVTTTNLSEGTNLYYTDARFDTRLATKSTTNLAEGTNLYHTTARARAAVSVTDAGGDGSLSYNSTTGVLTYTGPSAAEVRAHISAGAGITISSGQISNTLRIYDVNGTQVYP